MTYNEQLVVMIVFGLWLVAIVGRAFPRNEPPKGPPP
jgi:hypothetical protein